jgi:zinc transport system substrate-binding protein
MDSLRRRVLAVGLLTMTTACSPSGGVETAEPLVVVTIFPVADLVASVGARAIRVETLLPPRASPATWEATPRQLRALALAEGTVTVGGGLDGWVEGLGEIGEATHHLRITEGLVLHDVDHDHGDPETGDPHIWLDPVLVRDAVLPRIVDFLAEVVPSEESAMRDRANLLADSLTVLDQEIRELLSQASDRKFVATHDAWAYFCDRYELESLGSLYERPGHEPSARGLADLIEAARGAHLTAVLTEPQLAATAAQALAEELGAEIVVVDPLGGSGLDGREGYLDMMRFNARSFARALGNR